ncbi:MAG TPA: GTPase HflX [Gemmatimonadales bacterium]|nr:GTPase HflX [Gemmatimonadales bacterium]
MKAGPSPFRAPDNYASHGHPIRALIPVRDPIERAVLVAAPRKGSPDARHIAEHLEELTRLVDTAGAEVVGRISQHIAAPNPATLIGEGKVEEVADAVAAADASLVIFDEELTPVQGANLERELKVRVMDRPEVILDIFSTRARSHEAKLQVELAQLEYLLPRLTRMWTHLSRIRGGIGLRGPGETQLETDRRIIRRKIQGLKGKLKDVERHRENLRAARDPMLSVALVGYTNAGKSSILRALSGQHEIVVEDRLFATLDTLTREVDLGEGQRARVTDTVGFIRKLPHHLVASFRATLEEARGADVLLHIVDASHPDWEGQMRVVEKVLAELGLADRPVLLVFNKMDAVPDPASFTARVRALHPTSLLATTMRTDGLAAVKTALRELERTGRPTVRIRVPLADGARVAAIYRDGEVLSRSQSETDYEFVVRLETWQVARLREEGVNVAPMDDARVLRKASGG